MNKFKSMPELKKHMEKHSAKTSNTVNSSIPSFNAWAEPLQDVSKQDFHQIPSSAAPDLGTLVVTLNLINQRLQIIENKMSPQLIKKKPYCYKKIKQAYPSTKSTNCCQY